MFISGCRPSSSVPLFAISSCGWPSNLLQNRERKRGKEEWNRDRLSAPRHPEVRSCQMMRVYFEITAVTSNNFGDLLVENPTLPITQVAFSGGSSAPHMMAPSLLDAALHRSCRSTRNAILFAKGDDSSGIFVSQFG